jgi:predicted ATP-grasp superfamily ATP-dependent carboligase
MMKRFKIPAIVLGGGMNGLGVIRNLGRNGVNVYCIVDKNDPVISSGFCTKSHVVSHIQESASVLRAFLMKIAKNFADCPVLFSTNDLYSLHLAYLKDELEDNYYVPLAPHKVVKTLVNKREFYQSISKYSIPHPKTYFPESQQDVKRISKEIEYPVFVKPSMSQIFSLKFRRKGFVATSKEDLTNYYSFVVNHKVDVIFQEIIPGLSGRNMFGVEAYFDKNHYAKGLFSYIRLRGWPPVFGSTCLRESVSMKELAKPYIMVENYLRGLGYSGLMEAEWKKDHKNGVFKLLEINARQSMQNSLPARCGVNLVLMAYLDAIGEKVRSVDNYVEGCRWIDFVGNLQSVMKSKTSMKELLTSLEKVKEWSFFAVDDLEPWIRSSLDTLKIGTQRIFRLAEN